ncbi:MAG: hypothetical protein HY069_01080 [Chlamydiia bacterium]|nr:hypothetical protein [Chlamydiia bacterium]
MLLDRIGRICFAQMRPLFFFVLTLLPLLLSTLYVVFQSVETRQLEEQFLGSLHSGKKALQRKALQEKFIARYGAADPYFLEQQVETLHFLEKERSELKRLLHHPAVAQKDLIAERLAFLDSKDNQIVFEEQNLRTSSAIREAEEKMRHTIELDSDDLQKLLAILEDVSVGEFHPLSHAPQILIRRFHLQMQRTPVQSEVLSLDMGLLKREFTK